MHHKGCRQHMQRDSNTSGKVLGFRVTWRLGFSVTAMHSHAMQCQWFMQEQPCTRIKLNHSLALQHKRTKTNLLVLVLAHQLLLHQVMKHLSHYCYNHWLNTPEQYSF
jgi:hypothetical protein